MSSRPEDSATYIYLQHRCIRRPNENDVHVAIGSLAKEVESGLFINIDCSALSTSAVNLNPKFSFSISYERMEKENIC